MTNNKEYGQFLNNLNPCGTYRKVLSIDAKVENRFIDKVKSKVREIIKPAPIEVVKEVIPSVKKNKLDKIEKVEKETERENFNSELLKAMNSTSLISRKTKISKYTHELRGDVLSTIINNEYSGIITANGHIVEIKRLHTRPILFTLEPPKEMISILPKMVNEKDAYNKMIEFVMSKKEYFFSRKKGVGYSYGYSDDILMEIINSDYFGIITDKKHLIEFSIKDSRKIESNMILPYFMRERG